MDHRRVGELVKVGLNIEQGRDSLYSLFSKKSSPRPSLFININVPGYCTLLIFCHKYSRQFKSMR